MCQCIAKVLYKRRYIEPVHYQVFLSSKQIFKEKWEFRFNHYQSRYRHENSKKEKLQIDLKSKKNYKKIFGSGDRSQFAEIIFPKILYFWGGFSLRNGCDFHHRILLFEKKLLREMIGSLIIFFYLVYFPIKFIFALIYTFCINLFLALLWPILWDSSLLTEPTFKPSPQWIRGLHWWLQGVLVYATYLQAFVCYRKIFGRHSRYKRQKESTRYFSKPDSVLYVL